MGHVILSPPAPGDRSPFVDGLLTGNTYSWHELGVNLMETKK
jgi:hypothetical protein